MRTLRTTAAALLAVASLVGTAGSAYAAQRDEITGTSSSDDLEGTNGDDVVRGLGGNDALDGRKGHDVLIGGTGDEPRRIALRTADDGYRRYLEAAA